MKPSVCGRGARTQDTDSGTHTEGRVMPTRRHKSQTSLSSSRFNARTHTQARTRLPARMLRKRVAGRRRAKRAMRVRGRGAGKPILGSLVLTIARLTVCAPLTTRRVCIFSFPCGSFRRATCVCVNGYLHPMLFVHSKQNTHGRPLNGCKPSNLTSCRIVYLTPLLSHTVSIVQIMCILLIVLREL